MAHVAAVLRRAEGRVARRAVLHARQVAGGSERVALDAGVAPRASDATAGVSRVIEAQVGRWHHGALDVVFATAVAHHVTVRTSGGRADAGLDMLRLPVVRTVTGVAARRWR